MNIPNTLSLFRLLLTSLFILAVLKKRFELALWLFTIQALSDLLDGLFARLFSRKTLVGAYLDPLADKVMLISSYLVLYLHGFVPIWVVVTILARDLIIVVGLVVLSFMIPIRPSPSLLGKATTVTQMCTIIYLLFSERGPYLDLFFYSTCILTVASGVEYTMKGLNTILRREASIKSL